MRMNRSARYRPKDKRVIRAGLKVRVLSDTEICQLQWAVERAMAGIPVYIPMKL